MKPVQITEPSGAEPLLLDVRDVARLLKVSVRTVERMVRSGEFVRPISLDRRLIRWSRASVEAWIAERSDNRPRPILQDSVMTSNSHTVEHHVEEL